MRALFFRKLLRLLKKHTPGWFICFQLQILVNVTARAFHVRGKQLWFRSPGRALYEYALFTTECMKKLPASPENMYREAYRTGSLIRHITGFTGGADLQELTFYLYRNLRILMHGTLPGNITVTGCYFSRFYTPDQCRLMSCTDAGIIAGIYGGGNLEFTKRLTTGDGKCCACFQNDILTSQQPHS